jgi:hypothetical protein
MSVPLERVVVYRYTARKAVLFGRLSVSLKKGCSNRGGRRNPT